MSFAEFGLAPEILRGIKAIGHTTPTPIQHEAIPVALGGRDVIGCAQTGTGKTGAFVLPILQRLRGGIGLRALVLTPTRELAAQIGAMVREYGRFTRLRCAVLYGGVPLTPQTEKLRRGVDLVVATPGRLLDHHERGHLKLDSVQIFVLDEADRMLDMGFAPDLHRILRHLPKRRQTMLFSATIPPEIQLLASEALTDPVTVEVGRRAAPAEGITHVVHPVAGPRKRALLRHLLQQEKVETVLIFTRTKRGADNLAASIERHGFTAAALHSDRPQKQREKALAAFKEGRVKILVATDLASRGLDIQGISHVINFDIPGSPEEYVHRAGRTARWGHVGHAITLMAPDEEQMIGEIEWYGGLELPRVVVSGFEPPAGPVAQKSAPRYGEVRRFGADGAGERRAPGPSTHEAYPRVDRLAAQAVNDGSEAGYGRGWYTQGRPARRRR
ncbi:MAG: DEAD/DEAH box helicase [Deltaproteobacteria bacterium]|nr:DEAD/DEAH box helicase [Deltaproteobacteria bacterium]